MVGLYQQVLKAAGEAPLLPSRAPKASAAVVPWRERNGQVEVLWMRRASSQRFMGGWYAFPGGGVGKGDAELPVEGEPMAVLGADPTGALPPAMLDGTDLGPLMAPGVVAAALRELAEEIGWLVTSPLPDTATERQIVRALRSGSELTGLLAEKDLSLDASGLTYAGRWMTPPLAPLRFDNRFFLLRADNREPDTWENEVELAEWVCPAEAVARWQRGDVLTAPPVVHILRVLASGVPSDDQAMGRLVRPVEANLGPFRRIEFQHGVLQLPLRTATLPPAGTTNCFVIGDQPRVVIDPGSPFEEDQQRLMTALEELPGGAGAVGEIWLTHHHPDHVDGAAALAEQLGVPVRAHAETTRLLEGSIDIERPFEDGDHICLDGDPEVVVEVLHTPGHAPGHVCFAAVDGAWVIAGDMISGVSTIVIDPPEGNMGDYFASLQRMAAMNQRVVLPAHGPPLLGGRQVFTRALEHRRWREERVHAAWQDGERVPSRLVEAAYEEQLPPFVLPLAERQVTAHLQHLGLVGSNGDG